jgi:ActR/RegA family two-component response regulator
MHGALVGCDKYLTKPADAAKVAQVLLQYNVIAKLEGAIA